MHYLLKERGHTVMGMDISLTQSGFNVNRVHKIYNRDKLPLSLQQISQSKMPVEFKHWYDMRLLPINRQDVETTLNNYFGQPVCGKYDLQLIIETLSLLSHGRSITDKYWLVPLRPLILNIPKGFPVNGAEIENKKKYAGLDFHKNGISNDFAASVRASEDRERKNISFNTPDFCTNGKVKKTVTRIKNEFWLTKYYNHLPNEQIQTIVSTAIKLYKENPGLFPATEPVYDFNDGNSDELIGYRTKIFTSSNINLITFREICSSVDPSLKVNAQVLDTAISEYGLNKDDIQKMQSLAKENFKAAAGLTARDFYDNAGYLTDVDSKELIRPVMWL